MLKRNIWFVFIFCLILSCRHTISFDEESLNDVEVIYADYTDTTSTLMDILIDSISFIKLQTNTSCLIGEIDDIFFVDSTIVVVDKDIAKAVLLFDFNGRFLTKVSRLGNGPHEYLKLHDVCITPDGNIAIYDVFKDKIMFFDIKGKYQNEIKIPFRFMEMEYINSNSAVYNILGYTDGRKYRDYNYVVTDRKFNDMFFFGDDNSDEFTFWRRGIYRSNNDIFCTIGYNNIVYEVDSSGVTPKYCIDLPDGINNYSFSTDDEFMGLINKHAYFNGAFIELKDYTLIGCRIPHIGTKYYIFDHATKQTVLLSSGMMLNPMLMFVNRPYTSFKDNVIVQPVRSSDICSYKDKVYREFIDDYPQLIELYDELDVDDNPVLFFCNINLHQDTQL